MSTRDQLISAARRAVDHERFEQHRRYGGAHQAPTAPILEAIVDAVHDRLVGPTVERFEVHDDNLVVWACLADEKQVADRGECEVQGCPGPHHVLLVGPKASE